MEISQLKAKLARAKMKPGFSGKSDGITRCKRVDLKYPACLGHGHGLLLQLLYELTAHLCSRAKNTIILISNCLCQHPATLRQNGHAVRFQMVQKLHTTISPLSPSAVLIAQIDGLNSPAWTAALILLWRVASRPGQSCLC